MYTTVRGLIMIMYYKIVFNPSQPRGLLSLTLTQTTRQATPSQHPLGEILKFHIFF